MEQLLNILEGLHPEVDFGKADNLIDSKIFDSFDIVTLVAEINAQFDVAVPAEELIPANFNSAGAIWELIQRLDEE